MKNHVLTHEQIAHDLTVNLCTKSFPTENFPAKDSDLDDVVQQYSVLYEKILASVKKHI